MGGKRITLIRHAKSSWKYPGLTDFDRPLNGRGKRNAPFMGGVLRQKGESFDLLYSSPAKRAIKTAVAIAREVGYEPTAIQQSESLYHASDHTLFDFISAIDDTLDAVALVGHNPGLTDLANRMCGTEIDNIPTAGVVACEIPIELWRAFQPGDAQLLYFEYPRKYE